MISSLVLYNLEIKIISVPSKEKAVLKIVGTVELGC